MVDDINSLVGKGISPILDSSQAIELEKQVLQSKEDEWSAMKQVGQKISSEVLKDFQELKPIPENFSVLLLCGKGKNGGDGLLVADYLMRKMPRAKVVVFLATPTRDELHPLTEKALKEVEERVTLYIQSNEPDESILDTVIQNEFGETEMINICIDSLLGLGFKPPLEESLCNLVSLVNKSKRIEVRISVDVPTGLSEFPVDDELYFNSDFCYMAGIAKEAVFRSFSSVSRIRFIDIGLIKEASDIDDTCKQYHINNRCLDRLRGLRPVNVEKRAFGHLFIIAGSARMPGALLMSVKAALQSGTGLVTAFAPGSVVSSLCAQVPEAMWIPLPETNLGTINAQSSDVILSYVDNATAIMAGPGLGLSRNTEMVIQEILQKTNIPILLDADTLVPRVLEIIQKRKNSENQIVLTPHMGEFLRMTKFSEFTYSPNNLISIAKNIGVTVVLKGAMTRICDGQKIYINTQGGPIYSRGGSGDILAGIIGAQMAQGFRNVTLSSILGVTLHGVAGEYLARDRGQIMVRTSEVLNYLPQVIR